MLPHPPRSTLFPYTTLFRSVPKVILPMPRTVRPKDNLLMPLARARLVYFAQGLRSSEIDYSRNLLGRVDGDGQRSEEHTSELQSPYDLVCRLLLEKKKKKNE